MTGRRHWPEYAIEAASLAGFLVAAVVITTAIEHPASPLRAGLTSPLLRRVVTGLAMGATAATIIYSRWGQRSGAHLNPSITVSFLRLGKIAPIDAGFYVAAQFAGGALGIAVVAAVAGPIAGDPAVNYVATVPGDRGLAAAFAGELAISFGMMSMVLLVSNTPRVARYTGVVAACLIALYITIEAPLSGMSMNPARSFAPAVAAGSAATLWIYFGAPLAGMLAAAELYVRVWGPDAVHCAKLHHPRGGPCLFKCAHPRQDPQPEPAPDPEPPPEPQASPVHRQQQRFS
jgi:aquaporin Z